MSFLLEHYQIWIWSNNRKTKLNRDDRVKTLRVYIYPIPLVQTLLNCELVECDYLVR